MDNWSACNKDHKQQSRENDPKHIKLRLQTKAKRRCRRKAHNSRIQDKSTEEINKWGMKQGSNYLNPFLLFSHTWSTKAPVDFKECTFSLCFFHIGIKLFFERERIICSMLSQFFLSISLLEFSVVCIFGVWLLNTLLLSILLSLQN